MASPSRVRDGLTLEEFLELPEAEPAFEYIDGRIEAKVSPRKHHSAIQTELAARLNLFARPARLGRAFVELRCSFAGRSIVPDVVFLLRENIPVDRRGLMTNESSFPPDLHVAVLSPRQSRTKSHDKLAHATRNGCCLGWLIDPSRRTVDVYQADRVRVRLGADGVLEGEPVSRGLRLPVAEILEWLEP
jgi:Uma2 family endonuclease